MAKSTFELKLLIGNESKRVLFAETNEDAVDFLFSILSLPVATLVKLLQKEVMIGSFSNLYESLESLNICYIQPNKSKKTFLAPGSAFSVPLLLMEANQPDDVKKFYRCSNTTNCNYTYSYFTDDARAVCPTCKSPMNTTITYVAPRKPLKEAFGVGVGIVKEVVTYMVFDDLVIKPMSTISSITLLNKLKVKDLSVLEEKVVNLGRNEALKILSAMLKSKNVLTDVSSSSRMGIETFDHKLKFEFMLVSCQTRRLSSHFLLVHSSILDRMFWV